MRFYRAIAMILVLLLASSPTLAAICSTSCDLQSIISSSAVKDMASMDHCHDNTTSDDTNQSHLDQINCEMGAGCHFSQVVFPIDGLSKFLFADLTEASLPIFVPSGKSTDLSPPLKPPA